MALYRVEADLSDGGQTIKDGQNAVLVAAEDATEAKAVAAAVTSPGMSAAAWANATATEIVAPVSDLEGFRLRVQVQDTSDGSIVESITVTGAAAATVDAIGALAETALNATASIAGASYTAGTNVLIVALGSGTDDLGDHKVFCEFLPPTTWEVPDTPLVAFVGAITDEGVSTANLDVTLVDAAIPGLIATYNQLH